MSLSREEIQYIAEKVAEEIINKYQKPKTIEDGFAESMGEEVAAIQVYENRAAEALRVGDFMTKMFYTHLAGEEGKHFMEFAERLPQVGPHP